MDLEKEKWLYFRTVADEDDDDGDTASAGTSPTSLCVPAKNLLSIHPTSDTAITMNFKSVRNSHDNNTSLYGVDTVVLNIATANQGKKLEIMNSIIQSINSHPHSDGFITIADDMTTNYANSTVSAQYINSNIASCGAITCAAADQSVGFLPSLSMGGTAPTATAAGALAVNTAYTNAETAAKAYTIPSAAAGKAGDWITVVYTAEIGNTNAHTYSGTTDTGYAVGSVILRSGGSGEGKVDVSVALDDVITITGATNGDGGIGSTLKFLNTTGATNGWAVEAIVRSQGDGTTTGALAFSDAG